MWNGNIVVGEDRIPWDEFACGLGRIANSHGWDCSPEDLSQDCLLKLSRRPDSNQQHLGAEMENPYAYVKVVISRAAKRLRNERNQRFERDPMVVITGEGERIERDFVAPETTEEVALASLTREAVLRISEVLDNLTACPVCLAANRRERCEFADAVKLAWFTTSEDTRNERGQFLGRFFVELGWAVKPDGARNTQEHAARRAGACAAWAVHNVALSLMWDDERVHNATIRWARSCAGRARSDGSIRRERAALEFLAALTKAWHAAYEEPRDPDSDPGDAA